MKKTLLFLLLIATFGALRPTQTHAQSVAINADSSLADPSAILDLKSSVKGLLIPRMTMAQRDVIAVPGTGLLIYQTDNTPGFYYYDGATWSAVKGAASGGGTQPPFPLWNLSGNNIVNANTGGNIGIGTTTPEVKLTVHTDPSNGEYGLGHTNGDVFLATYVGGGTYGAWLGTRSNHDLFFFTNHSNPRMAITKDGYVGVKVEHPGNYFQIGSFISGQSNFSNSDFVISNNGAALAVDQFADRTQFTAQSDILLEPKLGDGTGHVGISTFTLPVRNKLQIGSVGTAGFNGNDIAFGNGAQATAIAQTATALQFASNTNMLLLPQYGTSNGRVGINTTNPSCPLDVAGYTTIGNVGYYWYYTAPFGSGTPNEGSIFNAAPTISIHAQSAIFATEYDAFSDARIKDIHGLSDASKDLQTLNALHVTDYTMKDKVMYRDRPFKKVIAQEVEKIYPQVISKHPDFIPNVLKLTDTIEKTAGGYCLHFASEHQLTPDAKRLRIIPKEQGPAQEYDILSIPSPREVVIAAPDLHTDKLFVYGQEVADFRTVDYEGLSTLNISATQELSKEVKELQRALAAANANIRTMAQMIRQLAKPKLSNRLTSAKTVSARTTVVPASTQKTKETRKI